MPAPTFSQVLRGATGSTTIDDADTPQPLVASTQLAKSVQVVPAADNTGNVLMSYEGTPVLAQLALAAGDGKFLDLARINIQSTVGGDIVNFNYIISY